MVHTWNPRRQKQEGSQFKAILGYIASSGPVRKALTKTKAQTRTTQKAYASTEEIEGDRQCGACGGPPCCFLWTLVPSPHTCRS